MPPSPQDSAASPARNGRSDKLTDDLDPMEAQDLGVEASASPEMAGAFDDPVSVDAEAAAGVEDDIEEAAQESFSGFQGRGPDFDRDAFEEWASISRDHPVLDPEETDEYVAMLQSDDEEVVEYATDLLVRHNIRWILHCLRKYAGSRIMDRPSDLRDDMLALGRMAFLEGLRGYDPRKAREEGVRGQKKTILKYTEFWIRKRVGEHLKRERYGLNEDAALDRKKIVAAERFLKKDLGRVPSHDEIVSRLEKQARAKLESQGVEPTARRLRKKGALSRERVRQLRRHRTKKTSFNAPAIPGESHGPTLAEYIEGSDTSPEEVVAAEERRNLLEEIMRKTPPRRHFLLSAWSHGLRTESGEARHELLNPEEIGSIIGRTRDTVHTYLDEYQRRWRGEALADLDQLTREGFPYSLETLRSMTEGEGLTSEVRAAIRREVDLADVVRADGIPLRSTGAVACPFEDGAGSFRVEGDRFVCTDCGREGDVFDWLHTYRGLSHEEADLAAGKLALDLPPSLEGQSGEVPVVRDPERRDALRRLS